MKLTEDDIDYFGHYDIKDRDRMKEIKQQILDAMQFYEKFHEDKVWITNTQEFDKIMKENIELKQQLDDKNIAELYEKARKWEEYELSKINETRQAPKKVRPELWKQAQDGLRLRELIEKRIEDFKDSSEGIDIILKKLLEESKK